jgi:hypothetical protein
MLRCKGVAWKGADGCLKRGGGSSQRTLHCKGGPGGVGAAEPCKCDTKTAPETSHLHQGLPSIKNKLQPRADSWGPAAWATCGRAGARRQETPKSPQSLETRKTVAFSKRNGSTSMQGAKKLKALVNFRRSQKHPNPRCSGVSVKECSGLPVRHKENHTCRHYCHVLRCRRCGDVCRPRDEGTTQAYARAFCTRTAQKKERQKVGLRLCAGSTQEPTLA